MTSNVLITGAGTGLGLHTALYLAARGFKVYATVPEPGQQGHIEEQARRHNVDLQVALLDVTDETSITTAIGAVVDECGEIYSVIHNAGVSLRGYFEDLDDDEIRQTLEINLFGAMMVTRAVLPHMRAAGRGRIVFISSIGGRIGSMARTAYCASKFGLEGFAESLMQEVSPLGITVSIVEPAIIRTERWSTNRGIARNAMNPHRPYVAWFRNEEDLADKLVRTSPTTPTDVAIAVHEALTARRPRLRYMVGRRARLVSLLRDYLPGESFERLYFGEAMRRVTRSGPAPDRREPRSDERDERVVSRDDRVVSLLDTIRILGLGAALRANRIRRFSQEQLKGFYTTRAIIALYNVGMLDEMSGQGSVDLDAFAESHALDATALRSLCDYLYAVNVLKRHGNRYAVDRRNPAVAATLNGPFLSVYAYQDVFHNLEALLRKEKTYGVDVTRQGELVARGSGAAARLLAFPLVADVLARNGFKRILDLCCGDATFLIDLCERRPEVTGYGVDISEEAIAFGRMLLQDHRLDKRVELVVGDVFEIDQVGAAIDGIDAATCVYALHEFLDDDRQRMLDLLGRFKSAFPGVPLVVCEVIRHTPEELRAKPGGVAEIQLWHELSGQRLNSRAQWKSLFRAAGFMNVHEDYVTAARTAVYTVS